MKLASSKNEKSMQEDEKSWKFDLKSILKLS